MRHQFCKIKGALRRNGKRNYPCEVSITCECDQESTKSFECQSQGQCQCNKGFAGASCSDCETNYTGFPNCQGSKHELKTVIDDSSKIISIACSCDPNTSASKECQIDGSCTCKVGFEGSKCTKCKPTYFGFPSCEGM